MQRLPTTHPSDTSKFPLGEGTFDIGAANEGSKILLKNFTPLNLDLDFLNGSTDMLHAWEINYWTLDADTKQIEWQIDADSLNVSAPPISAVFMTLYDASEKIIGTYPAFATVQTSLGGGNLNTLSNETSLNGSKIIDIGLPGNTDLIDVFNNGNMTWKSFNSILNRVFQVMNVPIPSQVLNAVVLQLGGVGGNITEIQSQLQTDNGITLLNVGISLLAGSLSRLNIITCNGVTNAGQLFAHGLGVKPDIALPVEINTASDTAPAVWDQTNSDATNIKLIGIGTTARNYVVLCIKM